MKARCYRLLIVVLSLTVLGMGLSGCGKRQSQGRTLRIVGSTSVFPFAELLAEAYRDVRPDIVVDVQAGGSTVGVVSAKDGICDIGTSSRELRPEEKEGLTRIEIARDGIAVIVHPGNAIDELTGDQVRDIYAGKITNWRQVGGADADIAMVTREEGSGTRGAFEEIVMGKTRISPGALVQDSNGSVREAGATSPNAIGYVSVALVSAKVKALAVDGEAPTQEHLESGAYKVMRPFLFLVKGAPEGETQKFIDFVLSADGQKVLKAEGLLSPSKQ